MSVLIVDMHNTVVDEIAEFGLSIEHALNTFIDQLPQSVKDNLNREELLETLYGEMQTAHIQLDDDWNNTAFDAAHLQTLSRLFNSISDYEQAKAKAIDARLKHSTDYIATRAYEGIVEMLETLQKLGHDVYIVTDASEQCVHLTLSALKLDGKIAGAYCCQSPDMSTLREDLRLTATPVTPFADDNIKPNALIVGQIALDVAKNRDNVDTSVKLEDVFELENNATADRLFDGQPGFVDATLNVKDTEYKDTLNAILRNMIGIGDDHRDLMLHMNAGIQSIQVTYDKEIPGFTPKEAAAAQEQGKAILKKVTGWNDQRLQLFSQVKQTEGKARVEKAYQRRGVQKVVSVGELGMHLTA